MKVVLEEEDALLARAFLAADVGLWLSRILPRWPLIFRCELLAIALERLRFPADEIAPAVYAMLVTSRG